MKSIYLIKYLAKVSGYSTHTLKEIHQKLEEKSA